MQPVLVSPAAVVVVFVGCTVVALTDRPAADTVFVESSVVAIQEVEVVMLALVVGSGLADILGLHQIYPLVEMVILQTPEAVVGQAFLQDGLMVVVVLRLHHWILVPNLVDLHLVHLLVLRNQNLGLAPNLSAVLVVVSAVVAEGVDSF